MEGRRERGGGREKKRETQRERERERTDLDFSGPLTHSWLMMTPSQTSQQQTRRIEYCNRHKRGSL